MASISTSRSSRTGNAPARPHRAAAAAAFSMLSMLHDRGQGPPTSAPPSGSPSLIASEERQRSLLRLLARHRGRDIQRTLQAETFVRKLRENWRRARARNCKACRRDTEAREATRADPGALRQTSDPILAATETGSVASQRPAQLSRQAVLGWSVAAMVVLVLAIGFLRAPNRAEEAAAGPSPLPM